MTTYAPLLHPAGVPRRRPVHPGRFLEREYLRPLLLSQTAAAQLLGISRRRVNEIVLGQRSMSADTAVRCAMAFGLPAPSWLALQARWDSWHAWRQLRHGGAGQRTSATGAGAPGACAAGTPVLGNTAETWSTRAAG